MIIGGSAKSASLKFCIFGRAPSEISRSRSSAAATKHSQMGSKSPGTMAASGVYFWIVFCKHTKFLSLSHGIASPESFLYIFTTVCIRRAVSQFVWADDLPGSVIYHIWANPCILQYALSNIRRRYMANNEQCTATFLSLCVSDDSDWCLRVLGLLFLVFLAINQFATSVASITAPGIWRARPRASLAHVITCREEVTRRERGVDGCGATNLTCPTFDFVALNPIISAARPY